MKIVGMNDIIKIGKSQYTVYSIDKDGMKLREVSRGNLQTLPLAEFEQKLSRHELEVITGP